MALNIADFLAQRNLVFRDGTELDSASCATLVLERHCFGCMESFLARSGASTSVLPLERYGEAAGTSLRLQRIPVGLVIAGSDTSCSQFILYKQHLGPERTVYRQRRNEHRRYCHHVITISPKSLFTLSSACRASGPGLTSAVWLWLNHGLVQRLWKRWLCLFLKAKGSLRRQSPDACVCDCSPILVHN